VARKQIKHSTSVYDVSLVISYPRESAPFGVLVQPLNEAKLSQIDTLKKTRKTAREKRMPSHIKHTVLNKYCSLIYMNRVRLIIFFLKKVRLIN